MQSLTCCFIGERSLPAEAAEHITLRLNEEVERLIGQGVRHFLSGGARGFDLIAGMSHGRSARKSCIGTCCPKRTARSTCPALTGPAASSAGIST